MRRSRWVRGMIPPYRSRAMRRSRWVLGDDSSALVPGNELPVLVAFGRSSSGRNGLRYACFLVPGNELPVLVAFGRSSSGRNGLRCARCLVPGNASLALVLGDECPVLVPGTEVPVLVAFGRSSSGRKGLRCARVWFRALKCPSHGLVPRLSGFDGAVWGERGDRVKAGSWKTRSACTVLSVTATRRVAARPSGFPVWSGRTSHPAAAGGV